MIITLFPIEDFNSARIGGIILHGPHHSAEKSTSTAVSVCINSEKVAILLLDFL
jgi:hypothetical protein